MSDSTSTPLDPIALLADLVAIDSVNSSLVPGAAGEGKIADFCSKWLADHSFEVHRLEATPGRPSIVGVARGRGDGRSIMLNGHIDTVTLAGYDGDPLVPKIVDGKLYGRGAFDMKGGVAAMMIAAVRATSTPLRGDVLVACVADEEHSRLGTAEVLTRFTTDGGIVTEPTLLQVTLSHKGFVWFDVIVHGRAAHGSRPDRDPELGTGSIHASIIQGGEEASSYPASCRITIERRTVPGESADSVEAELTAILTRLATTVPGFDFDLERGVARDLFAADRESAFVQTVLRHAEAVLGHPSIIRAEPFWTDASLMDQAGIPFLLVGAGGEGAHAATEWTDIASVFKATGILTAIIRDFCA